MKNTKIEQFGAKFNQGLASNKVADTKTFRKELIVYGINELGFTVASAASAYNNLVLAAIEQGTLVKIKRGKLALRYEEHWSKESEMVGMKWAIIDKETRKLVRYVPSKNKGFATKAETETVVKADQI